MLDKIFEAFTGRWGLAALVLLAIPDGRKALKNVAKEAIRAGLNYFGKRQRYGC